MSWLGLEPSPSNIGDMLAWPRVRAASDPLSYRPSHVKCCEYCLLNPYDMMMINNTWQVYG